MRWEGAGRFHAPPSASRRTRVGGQVREPALAAELRRLGFIPLIVVDEVGHIPFDPEAANLMFSLVSARYERASMILTSNKPFSGWARSSATRSSPPR
jgi:DNA replication protein DnaC